MADPIVGIDLGTSNSVVAYCDVTGTTRVLADESGMKIHPSVVSFHPSGGVVVGAAAKQRKVIDPANTIYSVKRLLGRPWSAPEVQTTVSRSPFQIKEGPNQQPLIVTRGGDFAVPEISAIVLDHVRNLAATALDTEVSRAVVTVPANFNDAQRSATATAGAIAGITVMRVLNEPTAAALAYGHSRNLRQVIAVYDFGGGTFDVTLLKLEGDVYEVLGTAGDSFLGGDDLDERIVDKMVNRFLEDHRIDLRTNEVSMMRLRAVAEQTKIELSRRSRAVVRIDEIAYGPKGAPLNLQIELTRDEFVTQIADIIDRTFPVCKDALQLARLDTSQVDDVILVGGTTKIPYVRDQVSKFFAKAPRTDVSPEEAVAVGAALQASTLERTLQKVSNRMPAMDTTNTDYTFNREDTVTVAQGLSGEPTDPRAKIMDDGLTPRPKKPSSIPVSKLDDETSQGENEIEAADTNVTVVPTAAQPNAKRATGGAYSERKSAQIDRFDDKDKTEEAGRAIGRLAGKPSPLEPMGKVPARKMPGPLPPASPLPPKVDPRLRNKSGLGPPGAPAPPRTGFQKTPGSIPGVGPPPGGDVPDPRGDTAVAMPTASPAAAPNADTMMVDVPETPMAPVRTNAGVGGAPRKPTARPDPLAGFGDELGEALGDLGAEDYGDLDQLAAEAEAAVEPPAHRAPKTFAIPVPSPSAVTLMPNEDEPTATTAPGPFQVSVPPAMPAAPPMANVPTIAMSAAPPPHAPPRMPPRPTPAPPPAFVPPPLVPAPPPYIPPAPQPLPPMPPPAPFAPQQQHGFGFPGQAQQIPGAMPLPPMPMAPARSPVVLDVTPRSLGIGTVAGYCEELIRRNSRVPLEMKKTFTTSREMQDVVRIVVCQGESRRLDNNVVLGDLVLQGLPARPRGETQIEVTFTLDASGILQVSARDIESNTEQRASVDLLGAMPDEDVESARERLQSLRR